MKRSFSFETVILLLLLVTLPAIFASGFTAYEVLKSGVLLLGGSLLLLSWAVRAIRGAHLRLQGGLLVLPLAALALFAVISGLWSHNPWMAFLEGSRWFALLAVLLVLLDPDKEPVRLPDAILALSVGVGGAAVVGLLQSQGVILDPLSPSATSDGLRGTFDHARYAALTLASCLPLLAAGIFAVKGARRLAPGIALALVALFVGGAEQPHAWWAAAGGVGVSLLALLVVRGGRSILPVRGALIALACAAGFIGVGAQFFQAQAPKIMAQVNGELVEAKVTKEQLEVQRNGLFAPDWGRPAPPSGANGRNFARSTAMRTVQGKPIGGIGAGNWSSTQVRYIDRTSAWYQGTRTEWPSFHSAHNSYLHVAAELGVIGVGLLVLFLIMSLAVVLRGFKAEEDENDARNFVQEFGLLGTVAAFLVAFWMDAILIQATGGLVFFVCLGLLLRAALRPMKRQGLASVWSLEIGTGGIERYLIAGLVPMVVAICGVALAVTWVGSDFFKARGDVWLRAGAFQRSEDAYQSALRFFPKNELALYNLAQTYGRRNELHEREKLYLQLVELRPNDPRLFRELGSLQVREAVRRTQTKRMDGNKIKLEPNPDGSPPKPPEVNPAEAFETVDKDVMRQAMINLNRAKDLHPRYLAVYDTLYNAYIVQQDTPRAQAVIKEALGLLEDKDRIDASRFHDMIGRSHMVSKNWNEALKHYKLAMELDPGTPRRPAITRDIQVAEAKSTGKPVPDAHGGHNHGSHGKKRGPKQGMSKKTLQEMLKNKDLRPPKPGGTPAPPAKKHDHKHDHGHDHDHDHDHKH